MQFGIPAMPGFGVWVRVVIRNPLPIGTPIPQVWRLTHSLLSAADSPIVAQGWPTVQVLIRLFSVAGSFSLTTLGKQIRNSPNHPNDIKTHSSLFCIFSLFGFLSRRLRAGFVPEPS